MSFIEALSLGINSVSVTLTCADQSPFALALVNQFEISLSDDEQAAYNAMHAGYTVKDVKSQLRIDGVRCQKLSSA